MNCTLTIAQQKLLFGKVAIDLKNTSKFDLKSYAKEFHDLILNKTGDKVLAANYVGLLPMNIRAVMGVNKAVFKKLAGVAGIISDHEAQFENYDNVEKFVNAFNTTASDIVQLEKVIQTDSLTKPPQQVEVETAQEIQPLESLSLSDVPFDNDKQNFLKPEMKVYADAKAELIKNKKADGTSEIGGLPVKITVVSTVDFRVGDLYPDTQRDIAAGKESAIKGSKEGVVLAVTRLDGTPIRFNDKLEQTASDAADGKIIFYSLRKPTGDVLNTSDKELVARIQKEQKISQVEAEAIVIKKLNLINKIREYVNKDPKKNQVDVNLTGGIVQYSTKPSKTKTTISKLNFAEGSFTPYKGTGTNGLKSNVYYFDYPGNVRMSIDSPSIPQELVQKLTQLLTEDIDIRAGKQSFQFTTAEKIRLFNQFIYTDPDVFNLSTDTTGNLVVKKLGVTQQYPTKEALVQDIVEVLTRKVPVKKATAEQIKTGTRASTLQSALFNQIWEQRLPDGSVNYYSIGQVQLKVNDTAFKNNLFNDFTLVPREGGFAIDVKSKPYYPFIADNFLIGYEVDGAGNLQTAGSVLNFEVQPDSLVKLQKENKEETSIITNNKNIKDELQKIITGNGRVSHGATIQAAYQHLRRKKGPIKDVVGKQEQIARDEKILREYIDKNDLWIAEDRLKTYLTKGTEANIYEDENPNFVLKTNNMSGYGTWDDYLRSLIIHNYLFPNVAYELIGFKDVDGKISPIVKQPYISVPGKTDLNKVEEFLKTAGFKKWPGVNTYFNEELGIKLEDLHAQNVLIKNNVLYFIDTMLSGNPKFYPFEVEEPNINDTPIENKLSAKEKLLRLRGEDPDKFNKLTAQKGIDATLEQIDAAEKWYNAHPMSAYFPFETMFDVVNQENSNSIATWTTSGITLFKGADYSDLYHEAWHGFTQGFLSKEEKTKLYNEAKKKTGSFVDYSGKLIEFKNANELQIEEFLAEDFRKYMLSDGKKVADSPVQNSIFRKILNFLKALFGSTSVKQTVTDEQANNTIVELYEKLRVGDISSYTFAVENRNYDTLNKSLQAITKEVEDSLSFENSNLIYNTVESLFSEGVDVMNQANLADIDARRTLQTKPNLTEAEKETLKKLNAQITSGYTTLLLSTPKGVRSLYQYTKDRLEDKLAELTEQNLANPSTYLQKKIDLLSYAVRNYGDVDKLYANDKDMGVIGYHMFKSGLIEDDLFEELSAIKATEEEDKNIDELTGRESEGKDYFDRGGNETSIFDLAIREIRNIIGSLNKTDIEGTVIDNQLGFPELVNYREAFAYIARLIQNSKDLPTMYSRLQQEQETYPPIKQLLAKLGPLEYDGQTDREVDLWSKFFQTFNKYRIVLVQTTINEEERFKEVKDPFGETVKLQQASVFDIRIGNALSDYKRVDQDWRDDFSKATNNPFIKNDISGNYFSINEVMDKYPTIEAVNAEPLQFLNDIGIKMKEINVIKTEVEKAIKSGYIRLNGIYKNLQTLNEKGQTVRGMGAYLNNNPKIGVVGQTGPNSNYGKLLVIQSKYSGDYSDFMVQNAAGDPQSEFSQNNTLTQYVKQFNASISYNDLISNPAMAHYNNSRNIPGRPYNPFVDVSIMMNSLYNMNESGGPRYPDNEIIIENLSGINSSINDGFFQNGVAASQSDEVGKLLNDFHLQLMKFTPALPTPAGKKTVLAVSLRNYKTGSKNSKLYIDTENFVAGEGQYNKGVGEFYKILTKYIGAELDRVNYAKYLLTPEAGVQEFDFVYLNRATKFVAFAGVLSEETKNALYAVQGNLADYLASSPAGTAFADTMYDEIQTYFNGLVDGVQDKMKQYNFISPSLLEKTKTDAEKEGGVNIEDTTLRRGLASSFVANNWIHHFEEMIMLYGDIALYKDFFKRNASLNSTGDIIRNDEFFIRYANNVLGKPFSKLAAAPTEALSYNGQLNTAIVADVLTKSVYLDEYRKTTTSPVIDAKYGDKGVNEADAQGLIAFDTYRIILKGLSKWTTEQEDIYQQLLSGTPATDIDTKQFFPTLKMGYYGPVQNDYLPLTGLHKFALFPLIPGVIPTNLQVLHEKMMKEGIDYLTFESGSKVGTISKRDGIQPLYSDLNKRELSTEPFVKNKIFSEYLKYQVETSPKWKGKMTLPTQLRKLAELGLMENGVPTDYKGGKEAWNNLNETQKKGESKNYRLRQNYIKSLEKLVEAKKNQLLGDIGWKKDKDGNLKGDMSSLLELISNELKRSDVGDHEWSYIQTIKGNDIKNSLDISQSADMIEKVITSLANKRLINIKVNGEQLVMVSTTGFEDKAFAYSTERNFEKPTDEDLLRYGTNDLPTYHIRNGKIAAAKVKIALQGDFKKLLNLSDVTEKSKQLGVSKLTALNILLKDETWLDQEDHRAMISLVGARIPTQGPNSVDFVEVYEFLPEIAGNIVIAPSEVTSKGGSDFDYDKLPLMMPNIRYVNDKVELAKKYNEDQAKLAYKELLKANIHKLTFKGLNKDEIRILLRTSDRFEKVDKIVAGLLGPDYYEELAKIVQEEFMESFEDFFETLNGTKAIENDLQDSLRKILELESNFADLIRPNDTDLIKPFADEIRGDASKLKEGTRMFEVMHNLAVQQANSVGKDTLGIGAINNAMNAVFDSVGVETLPQYELYDGDFRRATLLFKHNKTADGGISLSNRFDNLNENNIADVLSQLINGWVDVEKDDWISYIQGNKEIAPVMLFMVRAGVPIKDIIKFVTQPIVKQYAEEKRLAKNSFSKALLGSDQSGRYKRYAQTKILKRFGIDNPKSRDIYWMALVFTEGIEDFANIEKGLAIVTPQEAPAPETKLETFKDAQSLEESLKKKRVDAPQFQKSIVDLFMKSASEKEAKFLHRKFTLLTHPDKVGEGQVEFSQILNDTYDKYKEGTLTSTETGQVLNKTKKTARVNDTNLATFLHFIEIENMASQMDKLQRAFNVDTTTLQSLTEFYGKIQEIETLKGFVPEKIVEEIKNNSPIGPFYIQKFALDLFGRVLPLRNSKVVNEFLNSLSNDDIQDLYDLTNEDDRIRFYQTFKNDLFSYIFQNQLRGFNIDGQNYRNNKVDFTVKEVSELKFGAFVKDGTLFVDKAQLDKDYVDQGYSKPGYGNNYLALVPVDAFVNKDEYFHFVYERETLRANYPFNALNGSIEFNELVKEKEQKAELRKEGETDEEFIPRIEKIAYEELLRDKALYNIFNPYQLFKGKTNVANTYGFILDKYPQLKQYFSILNNIKKSSKEGFTNLMPSTLKFTKDEIDTFYENFKDLANSNKLLKVEGINQRDADYISSFFTKLPMYLYLQSGPNTRNAFSFGRIIPQEKIQRVLEKPVKDLTEFIDENYLKEFLPRFVLANVDKTTRQRFKEFLKPDQQKPTMQTDLFEGTEDKVEEPAKNQSMSYVMPAKDNLTGKDTTTLALVEQGLRTATTRSFPLGKIGEIVTFENRPQKYIITNVEQLTEKNTTDPNWIKQWSEKEQWTEDYYKSILNKKNTVKVGSYQTTFEKVNTEEKNAEQTTEPKQISDEEITELMNRCFI